MQLNREEFENICKPVMEWLNNNCHPHTIIAITQTDAELLEGVCFFKTTEYLID